MFAQSVTGVTEDPGLRGLARALDGERMLQVLAPLAGQPLAAGMPLTCSVNVLAHKLGRRCTLRYTISGDREGGQPGRRFTVIGKLYGKLKKAERLYQRATALRQRPFGDHGPLRIPAPLMLDKGFGLVLQEHAEGSDLRQAMSAPDCVLPLSLAGRWLALLHATPPLEGLASASLERELGKVDQWCEFIAATLADAPGLHAARERLHRFAGETPPPEPVMIHKDFYFGNVLWDGARLSVLDLDEMAVGDPALDVGHFLAHLEAFSYRTTGRTNTFAEAAAALLASYREQSPLEVESRLPFYRAHTFLKLAAAEASRKPAGWESTARALTGLAAREMQVPDFDGGRCRA